MSINLDILIDIKSKLISQAFSELGRLEISVTGDSMEPVLEDGETIKVIKPQDIKIGDIVWFIDDEGIMGLHRVISMNDKYVELLGDNADIVDRVSIDHILGKMLYKADVNNYKNGDTEYFFSTRFFQYTISLLVQGEKIIAFEVVS